MNDYKLKGMTKEEILNLEENELLNYVWWLEEQCHNLEELQNRVNLLQSFSKDLF